MNIKKRDFPGLLRNSTIYEDANLNSYMVTEKDGRKLFYIDLDDGRKFIFSTIGVMNYDVYFEENSVELE